MKRISALSIALLALLAAPLRAQTGFAGLDAPPSFGPAEPRAYGTLYQTSHTVNALDFVPVLDASTTDVNAAGSRWLTSGEYWGAPVTLPTGVLLTRIELQGCDLNSTGNMRARLFRSSVNGTGDTIHNIGEVSTNGDTACTWFGADITPHTVDSFNSTYVLDLQQTVNDGSERFQAVRLFYVRQVSPAPGFATFSDVPVGHPLHQFIEALAFSGITAGCGGGEFCPNAPLTRGQMAVFLAKALGLHWPF